VRTALIWAAGTASAVTASCAPSDTWPSTSAL
jgi:hypothetical protein